MLYIKLKGMLSPAFKGLSAPGYFAKKFCIRIW